MIVLSRSDSGRCILSVLVLRLFARKKTYSLEPLVWRGVEESVVWGRTAISRCSRMRRCAKVFARLELGSTRRMAKVKPDSNVNSGGPLSDLASRLATFPSKNRQKNYSL